MTAVMLLPPVSKSTEIRTKQGAGESSERLSDLPDPGALLPYR